MPCARQVAAEGEGDVDVPGVDGALLRRLLRAAAAREVTSFQGVYCSA